MPDPSDAQIAALRQQLAEARETIEDLRANREFHRLRAEQLQKQLGEAK